MFVFPHAPSLTVSQHLSLLSFKFTVQFEIELMFVLISSIVIVFRNTNSNILSVCPSVRGIYNDKNFNKTQEPYKNSPSSVSANK